MSDVVIAIPTVGERRWMANELIAVVVKECPGAPVVLHVHRPGDPARVDFPAVLDQAVQLGRPWVLQCEDDIRLAPGFGRLMLDALGHAETVGVGCVTFFSRSVKDLEVLARGETYRRQAPKSFSMSQCFAVQSHLLAGFSDWAPDWYDNFPKHNRAADLLFGAWLSRRAVRVLVHVPSLVQHRPGPSTLPNHHGARQSRTYRLVFGEH